MPDYKSQWGGFRPGAGRKRSAGEPKKPIPAKVSRECRADVKTMAQSHNVSQAKVVECAVSLLKRTPHDMRNDLLNGKKAQQP